MNINQEKLQEIGQKLLKRADLVTVGAFVLLLLISGTIFLREQGTQIEAPNINAPGEWERKIPSENFELVKASYLNVQPEITKDEEKNRLIVFPMFIQKTVASDSDMAASIEQDFAEAERLHRIKDVAGALLKIEDILRRNSGHTRALELKQKIEQEKAAAAAPTPAPPG